MPEFSPYKAQFQIEGELKPTTYLFISPFSTPNLYQTNCKYLAKYIIDNMPKFDQISPNIWARADDEYWEKMAQIIANYWEGTGGFCAEI